jgi:hypothetical protein
MEVAMKLSKSERLAGLLARHAGRERVTVTDRVVTKAMIAGIFVICSSNAIALTVEELEAGVSEALGFSTANSTLAIYVSGYVTGSVNSALSVGLACVDKNKASTLDLLRKVREYIQSHPAEKADGAQLIINRTFFSAKC